MANPCQTSRVYWGKMGKFWGKMGNLETKWVFFGTKWVSLGEMGKVKVLINFAKIFAQSCPLA